MQTKLFICHATPDDNEFAAWLAARLELHGYDVWVDVKTLDPATDSWNTIEEIIRDNTAKFLFVATKTSTLGNRDGVKKELAVADRVRKKGIVDFIVPLRVDDISFDDFPVEIIRQYAIDFYDNWAAGLIELLDYLEKKGINKTVNISKQMTQALERWREVSTSKYPNIVSTNDYYYSNLFPVQLPNSLYVYNDVSIEPFLASRHKPQKKYGNCILTFVCPDCIKSYCGFDVINEAFDLKTLLKEEKPIQVFGTEITIPRLVCVNLINWAVCNMFYHNGMRKYKSTGKVQSKIRYFFKSGIKSKRHENDVRSRKLSGKYKKIKNWHYAQSAYFTTFPFEGILFRAHLMFTDSSDHLLSDSLQLNSRRSKGKRFFNNEWRDLLQAAIYFFSGGNNGINMVLCCEHNKMIINNEPYTFFSSQGYVEPSVDPLTNIDGGFDDDEE
jgi:hypothetical protein